MVMQCKELISLGSTVRIPLSKALGEAKNSTLLYARGVECISIDAGDFELILIMTTTTGVVVMIVPLIISFFVLIHSFIHL